MKQIEETPSDVYKFVFGNHTWGKSFPEGFSALRELDKNNDGKLSGDELGLVGVWQDANSNAVVDEGEVRPVASAGIESLAVSPSPKSPEGNYMNEAGAVKQDGSPVHVWDWWSAGSPLSQMKQMGRVWWEKGPFADSGIGLVDFGKRGFADGSLDMASKGELIFYQTESGDWFVRATATLPNGEKADMLYPVNVMGESITWGFSSGNISANNVLMKGGSSLLGITTVNDGRWSTWKVIAQTGALPVKSLGFQ